MSELVTLTVGLPGVPKIGSRTRSPDSGRFFDRPTSDETARVSRAFSDSPRSAARALAFLISSGGSSTVVRIKA
jgi:hypothetical protein